MAEIPSQEREALTQNVRTLVPQVYNPGKHLSIPECTSPNSSWGPLTDYKKPKQTRLLLHRTVLSGGLSHQLSSVMGLTGAWDLTGSNHAGLVPGPMEPMVR